MESKVDPSKKDVVNLDNFLLKTVIGRGSYAKVVLVKKKDTGEIFAMKILKKKNIEKRKQEEHVITERNVLVWLQHPFIIRMFYSFQNEKKLFFVLEYCAGGELFNLLQKRKQFTEDQLSIFILFSNFLIIFCYKGPNFMLHKWCWLSNICIKMT